MTSDPLRIVFAGTPDFAAIHLRAILERGKHRVVAAYTQPDRPAGRGKKLKPGPVKILAQEHGIPVHQPVNFKAAQDRAALAALAPDVMVVVAYGLLLPASVLQIPRLGCINVHGSLLPRWRGAAPIQRAIEAGDEESGVTIMQMDEGLDTGAMLLKARCAIDPADTAADLHDKLARLGGPALNDALDQLAAGTLRAEAQDDALSCYAPKISKQEAIIDWRQPAALLDRQIRAFNPFPIMQCQLGDQRIKVWRARPAAGSGEAGTILRASKRELVIACGEEALELLTIQLPGGKALDIPAVMNARADWFRPGDHFQLHHAGQ